MYLSFAVSIVPTITLVICCCVISYPKLGVLKPIKFRCGLGAGAKAVDSVLVFRGVSWRAGLLVPVWGLIPGVLNFLGVKSSRGHVSLC